MPVLLALVVLLSLVSAADARARWRWPVPVPHAVLRSYRVGPDRYAAGQHRGVTLAAPPGAAVTAACAGRVTFAGRVGESGATVAVACGALSATYTHLGSVSVRRGAFLVPGERVGAAGRRGTMQLGARVRRRRDGYLDPLRLLGVAPRRVPVGPVPPAPRGRRVPSRPLIRPVAPAPAVAPMWPAALGLGLLGAAGAFGAGRRVRRLRLPAAAERPAPGVAD